MGLKINLDVDGEPLTLICDDCGRWEVFDQESYVEQRHAAVLAGWKQHGENYEFRCPTCLTQTGKLGCPTKGDTMLSTGKRRATKRRRYVDPAGRRLTDKEIEEIVNPKLPKPRGGKNKKEKGDRFERECVDLFMSFGLLAERVPLSGAAGGSFGSDIQVTDLLKGGTEKYECKSRARAWGDLYGWLVPGVHALLIKRDRSEPLIVMKLKDYLEG